MAADEQLPQVLHHGRRSCFFSALFLLPLLSYEAAMKPDLVSSAVRAALRRGILAQSALFVDAPALRHTVRCIAAAFPPSAQHVFALKANPATAVAREVLHSGMHGCEVASRAEAVHALTRLRCAPHRVVFDSPAKTVDELRWALETVCASIGTVCLHRWVW